MKIWIIKRKGADYFQNYMHSKELEITLGSETTKIYAQLCFYRKKDAALYLKAMESNDLFEVVGKS